MVSLPEVLFSLSADTLRAIAEARKIPPRRLASAPTKRHLVRTLAAEIVVANSVAQAVMECNVRELRLLQIAQGVGPGPIVKRSDLKQAMGAKQFNEAIAAAGGALLARGLLLPYGNDLYVPDNVFYCVPPALAERISLSTALGQYDAPALRVMRDSLGLPGSGGTKPVMIQEIADFLLSRPEGLCLPRALDEEEERVIERLVSVGGSAPVPEIIGSLYKGAAAEDFFRFDWQNRWKSKRSRNAIDRLLSMGILTVVAQGYGYNLLLVIPRDILRRVSSGSDETFWTGNAPAPVELATPPRLATTHSGLLRDIISLLAFVTVQETARTNTGIIHRTALKQAARSFKGSGDRYALFVYALAREAGLMDVSPDDSTYTVTELAAQWLRAPSGEQQKTLISAWRDNHLWGEMFNEPLGKARSARFYVAESIDGMRSAAIRLMSAFGGTGYADISSLAEALSFERPLLLAELANVEGLVPSPADFVRNLVAECLYWLGLAELGWADDPPEPRAISPRTARGQTAPPEAKSEPVAYRLVPGGKDLLNGVTREVPSLPRETEFVLQANGEIFLSPYLAPDLLYKLLVLAEVPSAAAAENTVVVTRESVRKALDAGSTPASIVEFLASCSRTGVPQNVEHMIREVGGRHGHLRIGVAGMYIKAESPQLLQELQARRELKAYSIRLISDTVAVLTAPDIDRVLRDLRKAGYLPVEENAARATASGPRVPAANSVKRSPRPEIGATVDWARMAREDNVAWSAPEARAQPSPAKAIPGAITDPRLVRFVLQQAANSGQTVEVCLAWSKPGTVSLLSPARVDAASVSGQLDLEAEPLEIRFSDIQWARLPGKPNA